MSSGTMKSIQKSGQLFPPMQSAYLRMGTETTIFERTLNLEPEKYALSSEILDRLNAEESRTVTVVVNPGTEQEYSVSETVGKGCSVSTYTGDAVLYTDEKLYRRIYSYRRYRK